MKSVFPDPIVHLPLGDIPIPGCRAYLMQGVTQQVLFMEFAEDVEVPEHAHAAQAAWVVEGRIDLRLDGRTRTYGRGDRYFIPAGVKHGAKIHAGYADITYFDQPDRYAVKKT